MKTDPKTNLREKQCSACQGGVKPLQGEILDVYRRQLDPSWQVHDQKILERTFKFRNFKEALDFANAVGLIAEEQGHHPEITFTWGRATLRLWTHKIGGLHENDFILAAKIDQLPITSR